MGSYGSFEHIFVLFRRFYFSEALCEGLVSLITVLVLFFDGVRRKDLERLGWFLLIMQTVLVPMWVICCVLACDLGAGAFGESRS